MVIQLDALVLLLSVAVVLREKVNVKIEKMNAIHLTILCQVVAAEAELLYEVLLI
jgi:hypothetical protein